MLDKYEWDNICYKKIIEEPYIFCYFLGDDEKQRKIVTDYAKVKNLRIVTLPNMDGRKRKCDNLFGNFKLYSISPDQFISLIKYSEMVFTDSFHASAFSIIYDKDFFVFPRKNANSMSNRIISLLQLFKIEERFCIDLTKQNYNFDNGKFIEKDDKNYQKEKKNSMAFLQKIVTNTINKDAFKN